MSRKRAYHDVLGVKPDATPEQITKAYRRLSVQLHPDRNPGRDGTAFVEMKEAYSQMLAANPVQRHFPLRQWPRDAPVQDISLKFKLSATVDEIYRGFTKEVEFDRRVLCNACFVTGPHPKLCATCKGSGKMFLGSMFTCVKCTGSGVVGACAVCHEKRFVSERKRLRFNYEPRQDMTKLRMFPDKGHERWLDGAVDRGFIEVTISVVAPPPDPRLTVDLKTGAMTITVVIPLVMAIVSEQLFVPLPGGATHIVRSDELFVTKRQFRFPNMGLYKSGELIVLVDIAPTERSRLNVPAIVEALTSK